MNPDEMKLPTEQQCQELFRKYKVPPNIKQHCEKVRETAVFLAKKLKEAGENINLDFVSKLALLHDLFKMVALKSPTPNKHHPRTFTEEEVQMWKQLREKYPGMNEGDVAHIILKNDYPELASSLQIMGAVNPENLSKEELITHYVDGRIFRAKVVSLQERLNYTREFYPYIIESAEKDFKKMIDFEDKLKKLNINPEQIK